LKATWYYEAMAAGHVAFVNVTGYKNKREELEFFPFVFGGDEQDRTAGLLNAIQALSQLSYTPNNTSGIVMPP
jgi:hypothetical protein